MKLRVLGASRMVGKSRKTGNDYDMCRLFVLTPIEPRSNDDYQLVGHGFQVQETECTPECVIALKAATFPFEAEFNTEDYFSRGRINVRIVGPKVALTTAKDYAEAKAA